MNTSREQRQLILRVLDKRAHDLMRSDEYRQASWDAHELVKSALAAEPEEAVCPACKGEPWPEKCLMCHGTGTKSVGAGR